MENIGHSGISASEYQFLETRTNMKSGPNENSMYENDKSEYESLHFKTTILPSLKVVDHIFGAIVDNIENES